MSQYFSMSSIWLISMTSEISLRLCASAARRSICSPCSPRPWKLYGELRGLNAPPRRIFAPARRTAAAVAITCSSVSAEHGPAIMITSSPPIRTSSIVTIVSSGLKVRLARLYGSEMRSTSCTPSRISMSSFSTLCAPTTPSTVRVAPEDRCTSMPSSISLAMTESICASVARSFMTTTMAVLRGTPQGAPYVALPQFIPLRARLALGATRFIDDAFENPDDRFGGERTSQLRRRLADAAEHLRFAFRLIDRQARLVLQASHFNGTRHAHVEQPYQLLVDHVDAGPQLLDCQDFSQRTYSSTRPSRSSAAPASAMTLTSALPTTAASAQRPTSRTCSGFEMPKPRATGRSLTRRMRCTISCAPSARRSRAPVTPRREIA